jgi:prevent-host-death family protein
MPKTVSSSEAQNKFGTILQWAIDHQDDVVVVERRGKPAAVLMTYAEYEEMAKLRRQEQKRQALEALREIRRRVREQNQDLTAEEAYRLAGFGEEVIRNTLISDQELAKTDQ